MIEAAALDRQQRAASPFVGPRALVGGDSPRALAQYAKLAAKFGALADDIDHIVLTSALLGRRAALTFENLTVGAIRAAGDALPANKLPLGF